MPRGARRTVRSRGLRAARYEFGGRFRAPLGFVYRWCLDYSPEDPKIEGSGGIRRIAARSAREVVYEDLEEAPTGWNWSHIVVTKRPPNGWHAKITGSHRHWTLEYSLRELPDGSTELRARGRRRPTEIGGSNPPKAELERELNTMWTRYGRALERDYRASQRARPRRS